MSGGDLKLVIASEAKQSSSAVDADGLLRRCAPRNDEIGASFDFVMISPVGSLASWCATPRLAASVRRA